MASKARHFRRSSASSNRRSSTPMPDLRALKYSVQRRSYHFTMRTALAFSGSPSVASNSQSSPCGPATDTASMKRGASGSCRRAARAGRGRRGCLASPCASCAPACRRRRRASTISGSAPAAPPCKDPFSCRLRTARAAASSDTRAPPGRRSPQPPSTAAPSPSRSHTVTTCVSGQARAISCALSKWPADALALVLAVAHGGVDLEDPERAS